MAGRYDPASPSLLSPGGYDDDNQSVRSLSEQDSDSEDDEILRGSRTTLELAQHDRTVLDEEEELEKLLTKPTDGLRRIFSSRSGSVRIGKRERRRQRRREKRAARSHGIKKPYQEGDLMFEMEEGYRDSEGSDSTTPPEIEKKLLHELDKHQSKTAKCGCLTVIFSGITILFLILLLGAYKASGNFRSSHRQPTILSNGTALFAPTTILVSLDGFRADFLNRGLTPRLNAFISEGVSPRYMYPCFPSVTFPNHYTLVTGMYPESHGIISNDFWDEVFAEQFEIEQKTVTDSKWWSAEPLWVTAEKQGIRTAIHMWPGSEAHIGGVDPFFYDKYNGSELLTRKVDRVLQWLDLPGLESEDEENVQRPQLIAAYVPNVDSDGHKFGPNSTEIRSTIASADNMLDLLFQGLEARNLTDIVNVVVVSDHGMATTSTQRLVQLEDLVDLDLVGHIDGWPLRGLRPKRPEDLSKLQEQLFESAKAFTDGVEVYSRETMPDRFHFSNNDRIAPLWVIPKTGWAVVERPEFDVQVALETDQVYHPRGIHGYDHEHPLMRAIFIARGPAFPHAPNSRIDVFQNIEVYNILCDSIGLEPLANNGTLRLPLRPIGLHDDENAPVLENPEDPPLPSQTGPVPSPSPTQSSIIPTLTEETPGDDSNEKPSSWWDSLKSSFDSFKNWALSLFDSKEANGDSS